MIAVSVVRMMQMAVHQIIDVIAVGNRFMATAGSVDVIGGMGATGVIGRARRRIRFANGEHVLVNVSFMRRMQMAIVEVVDMAVVQDGGVSASRAMDMIMIFVYDVTHLWDFLSVKLGIRWHAPVH